MRSAGLGVEVITEQEAEDVALSSFLPLDSPYSNNYRVKILNKSRLMRYSPDY